VVKVLFIAFDSTELSIRLASALAEHVDVCLMIPEEPARPHLKWLDPKVDYQPFVRPRLRQFFRQVPTIQQIIRRIKRYDPDVIHFQKWHLWFFMALWQIKDYPLVISIHDPIPHPGDKGARKTPQPIIRYGYRQADRVIAHNEQMKQIIVDEIGIPDDLIDIVPLVERGDADLWCDVEEAGNEILFFGRVWRYKGLEYLIKAEPLISERFPDIKIVIAGRGDNFQPYLEMMVHPERFEIHNEFVPEEKVARLFRRASVIVLPYIEATQSGVIPVAYTYEKPVVATTVGGLPSQVDHEKTGFLVPPCDSTALAEAVIRLMGDEKMRHEFGRNGKMKLQNEWSAEAIVAKTLPIYRKALEDHSLS
jgi:glycosyltransferase involved in cell wall biosynthesis